MRGVGTQKPAPFSIRGQPIGGTLVRSSLKTQICIFDRAVTAQLHRGINHADQIRSGIYDLFTIAFN
jgi:hypothetical protein